MKQPESAPLIDVVESVDYGYRFLGRERHYLMRIAIAPLAIKMLCLLVLIGLGWERDFIRSALIMLPAYFAEGWMLAHLIRLVFYGQRWPFQPTGNVEEDRVNLQGRIFGVTGGTLFYVLIKFLLSGFLALMASTQGTVAQIERSAAQGDPSHGALIGAFMILAATLWCFRFVFFYVPASAGLSIRPILMHRRGMMMSIQMLGIWLVCFVPFAMLLLLMTSGLVGDNPDVSILTRLTIVTIQAICDTAIAIVTTMAIASGFRKMLENQARSG